MCGNCIRTCLRVTWVILEEVKQYHVLPRFVYHMNSSVSIFYVTTDLSLYLQMPMGLSSQKCFCSILFLLWAFIIGSMLQVMMMHQPGFCIFTTEFITLVDLHSQHISAAILLKPAIHDFSSSSVQFHVTVYTSIYDSWS